MSHDVEEGNPQLQKMEPIYGMLEWEGQGIHPLPRPSLWERISSSTRNLHTAAAASSSSRPATNGAPPVQKETPTIDDKGVILPTSSPQTAHHPPPPLSTRVRSSFDRVFPPQKRYIGGRLSRRSFLSALAALLLILFILILGLGLGLGLRKKGGPSTADLPLPSHGLDKTYTGDMTYFDLALGACGLVSNDTDMACAVAHSVFDAVSTSSDPNANPLCGRFIMISKGGKSVAVTVVDRCVGCQPTDLDVSPAVFGKLAEIAAGRVIVSWKWE
ncbi:RlpA-like double-psi beta-barrel-protein domain-containing protein-containing protein [Diplogelasinospora grovesii]|uniref:RlpA-like double-psi beta-barrel-protein domain-containing protein-containing protein n=1 Tax=Diplogelasinospora grovesii TaxID=303347 RepID=A0AAN6N2S9_9PEZI|nr:RlpA-like double-psi beta-barrel-protein domain-containing protein-containing protein [Diplogelasinospora grovesii]